MQWSKIIICIITMMNSRTFLALWMYLHISGRLCAGGEPSMMPLSVTMATLKNASVLVCSDTENMPLARMVEMSDEQLRTYFEAKGGNYVRDYMASTQEEALENFPNMLLISSPVTIPGKHSAFSLLDNVLAKQIIVSDLEKLVAYLKSNNTTGLSGVDKHSTETVSQDKDGLSMYSNPDVHLPNTESSSSSASTPPTEGTKQATNQVNLRTYLTPSTLLRKSPTPFVYRTPSVNQHVPQSLSTTVPTPQPPSPATTSRAVPTPKPPSPTKTSRAVPTPQTTTTTTTTPTIATTTVKTTTVDPDVAKGLDQLNQYVEGSSIGKRDLSTIWREANTTLHPTVLLGLVSGTRRKRNADGSYSQEEYCQSKGSQTDDGKFIHLCSICAATTRLPEGYYPRYINEAICKTDDSDCFTVGNTAHGECKQTRFSLNMMRKRKGQCQMILHDGETLVFEDWELMPTQIRVACECTINKLSAFSTYVGQAGIITG